MVSTSHAISLAASNGVSTMNEVESLRVEFKEALNARDRATLLDIHLKAIGLVSQHEKPPVIAANKKRTND